MGTPATSTPTKEVFDAAVDRMIGVTPQQAREALEKDAQVRVKAVDAAIKKACEEHRCQLEVFHRPMIDEQGRIVSEGTIRIVAL